MKAPQPVNGGTEHVPVTGPPVVSANPRPVRKSTGIGALARQFWSATGNTSTPHRRCCPRCSPAANAACRSPRRPAGLLGVPGDAPYSVTKHAALALAGWLAITYRPRGVRVSALCPLGVRTALLEPGLPAARTGGRRRRGRAGARPGRVPDPAARIGAGDVRPRGPRDARADRPDSRPRKLKWTTARSAPAASPSAKSPTATGKTTAPPAAPPRRWTRASRPSTRQRPGTAAPRKPLSARRSPGRPGPVHRRVLARRPRAQRRGAEPQTRDRLSEGLAAAAAHRLHQRLPALEIRLQDAGSWPCRTSCGKARGTGDLGVRPPRHRPVRRCPAGTRRPDGRIRQRCGPAGLALAWTLQHETVAAAVVGASTPEQVTENAKAAVSGSTWTC